jgi:hypothetical protein
MGCMMTDWTLFDDLAFADIDDSFEHTRYTKGAAFRSFEVPGPYQHVLPESTVFFHLSSPKTAMKFEPNRGGRISEISEISWKMVEVARR